MPKNTVSACLIVCNEEHCLARCLDSIYDFVDQIVIIDTGSTDSTVSIAKSYGATVKYFAWNKDFSAARNYALLFAEHDWIFVIDADEELVNGGVLLNTLNHPSYDGYYVTINSKTPDGQTTYDDYVVRLFRNNQGFRFTGAIHEQVAGSIKQLKGEASIAFSPIVLQHDGYLTSEICRKQKNERNRSIIADQLFKNDHDPFLLYCFGIELVQANKLTEAAHVLRQALNKFQGNEGYFRDYLLLTLTTNIKIARYQESESIFNGALAMLPSDPDILFLECIRQANLNNYPLAWNRLTAGGINTSILAKALVNTIAGELLNCQELYQPAIHYFQQSMNEQPTIFATVSLIEIALKHNIQLFNVFSPIKASYLPLVRDAQSSQDYSLAAILLLLIMSLTEQGKNSSDLVTWYQNIIEQAHWTAEIKNLLRLTARQIDVYDQLAAHDLLIPPLNISRILTIQDSLNLWLRLWPKHNFSTKLWECCL